MGIADPEPTPARGWGTFEPLRQRSFRRIWTSSLISNFGSMIMAVGAAWEMTRLAGSPAMVALVQSALSLPMVLLAVPAGAVADMFDRRKVAIAGLAFALVSSVAMAALSALGAMTPWVLLAAVVLIGSGTALYFPAWQASVREQVEAQHLPNAVSLVAISFNIARGFGPAVGGVVVLLSGAQAAFAVNALSYCPLILAYLLWRRRPAPSRLPPERIDRAMVAGARHVFHSPPLRAVLARGWLAGLAVAGLLALPPIIARDMLAGGADTYGLILGMFGTGAVAGALTLGRVRDRMEAERAARLAALTVGLATVVVGLSHRLLLTCAAMFVAGGAWLLLGSLLNLSAQLSAPRWVAARALSWYQSLILCGVAVGSWLWGGLAGTMGVGNALVLSGLVMGLSPLIGLVLPLPRPSSRDVELIELAHEPEVGLALTARSGPVVIEVDYRIAPARAREFYGVMLQVQRSRQRNSAYGWTLARNIADPAVWTERFHYPTWGDYLRQRNRMTQADRELVDSANAFRVAGDMVRPRRMLERPFGSVRWRADTPDERSDDLPIYTP